MPTEIEVFPEGSRVGVKLPTLHPKDLPASFSSYERKGRIIYLVECASDDLATGIWKVEASKAVEVADPSFRLLRLKSPSEGMGKVAMLFRGQSYELPIVLQNGRKGKLIIKHL